MKYLPVLYFVLLFSCSPTEEQTADLLVFNGKIYTVDAQNSMAEAFVVKDGRILEIGPSRKLMSKYKATELYNANGQYIYPGFIDAHCHFYGYGTNLFRVDLSETNSFDEVLERLTAWNKANPDRWIVGRGWDQNEWAGKKYPDNTAIDKLFPNVPVILQRIDGHAVLANSEALKIAGITGASKIPGGIVEVFKGTNKATGVLIDNAADQMLAIIPPSSKEQQIEALHKAQNNCFQVGLTSIVDAGLDRNVIEMIDSLQKAKILKMRIYAMISANKENLDYYLSKGHYKTDYLNVRSFKFYGDGSLGSRGALLLEPYSDKSDHYGLMIHEQEFYKECAQKLYEKGFQMNTHCIGDSAVRMMLNIYGDVLKSSNDLRWRIEHSQVVHPDDLPLFAKYTIIPSVQPTHATSDMYWLEDRLGKERIEYSSSYNDLLKQNGFIASGSDFPVESINPLLGFYAAVSRKDLQGYPEGGFNNKNALTREQALKAMTIWAAIASFEEKEKGSLEPGKFADFVILENDIITMPIESVPSLKVVNTFIGGEKVY
ncbi:MAG: amidohydrolase [Bacteroidota bacterium]|nr:amidohydrolase [Bacteroidota bacterium]